MDFLPQLLEALKNETWTVNHLSKMMLEQSLSSPKVSHALFWLIAQSLPGQTPHGIDIFVSQIFWFTFYLIILFLEREGKDF